MFISSLSLNHKPKRGFAGFSDEYHARSEYVQIGRRLNFLKINGDKIEVYQFVIINVDFNLLRDKCKEVIKFNW